MTDQVDDLEIPAWLRRPPETPEAADARRKRNARAGRGSPDRIPVTPTGMPKIGTKEKGLRVAREEEAKKPSMAALAAKLDKSASNDVTDISWNEMTGADLRPRFKQNDPGASASAETDPAQAQPADQQETTTMETQTTTTDKPKRVRKSRAKVAKPAKKAKVAKPRLAKADGPSGKAAEVGKLASRANGASRAELIELTGWKQQAWKWYFHNSKGTGFCQRFGYKLEVIDGKDGESRYKITKK